MKRIIFASFHMQKSPFSQWVQLSSTSFCTPTWIQSNWRHSQPASWNMTKQCSLYDEEAADLRVAQRRQQWLWWLGTQPSERPLKHADPGSEYWSELADKFRYKKDNLEADSHQQRLNAILIVLIRGSCPNWFVNNDEKGDFDFGRLLSRSEVTDDWLSQCRALNKAD